jgi:hypothetical protein
MTIYSDRRGIMFMYNFDESQRLTSTSTAKRSLVFYLYYEKKIKKRRRFLTTFKQIA